MEWNFLIAFDNSISLIFVRQDEQILANRRLKCQLFLEIEMLRFVIITNNLQLRRI